MGEHRYNPTAQAKARGEQVVNGMDLGEQCALIGTQLMPVMDEKKENLVILLCAIGGHLSPIVGGFTPKPVILGELAKIPIASIRRAIKAGAAAVEAPDDVTPSVEPPAAAPEAPKLLLFGGRE